MNGNNTFTFFGRIHPQWVPVWTDSTNSIEYNTPHGDLSIEIFIHNSQIIAESTNPGDIDVATLKNYIESSISGLTDSFAFINGQSVEVRVVAVATPSGDKFVFGVKHDYIEEKLEGEEAFEEWQSKIMELYHSEYGENLQRSMRDFRLALKHAEDTGFYCYRAIESLRQTFKEEGVNDRETWEKLRDLTDTKRETIDENITRFQRARRHGDTVALTGEERRTAIETAWEIIHDFIENAEDIDEVRNCD